MEAHMNWRFTDTRRIKNPEVFRPAGEFLTGREMYKERNDCCVRAYTVALGIPYAEAHAYFKILGRRDKRGVTSFRSKLESDGRFELVPDAAQFRTVMTFAQHHPRGRYIVHVNWHAIPVVNGVVYDSQMQAKRRVTYAFKVKEDIMPKHELDIPPFLKRTKANQAEYAQYWKDNPPSTVRFAPPPAEPAPEPDAPDEFDVRAATRKKNRFAQLRAKKELNSIPPKFREWSTRYGRYVDSRIAYERKYAAALTAITGVKVVPRGAAAPKRKGNVKCEDRQARYDDCMKRQANGQTVQAIADFHGLSTARVRGILKGII
jgi:hypothetical protein